MNQEHVDIQTKDGTCKASVLTPEGKGRWPAVIFYMDAFGIRPAMIEMANHIAKQGYVVLLPDLFYRFGAYGPYDPKEVLKGDFRAIIGPMMGSTDNHKTAEDTSAFLAYLDSRGDVAGKKVGTVGFCMGGGMALTAAGYYPDRVAAGREFPWRQPRYGLAGESSSSGSQDQSRGLCCGSGQRSRLSAGDGSASRRCVQESRSSSQERKLRR